MSVQQLTSYRFKRTRYMSESEYARKIYTEYQNARTHDQKNFDRCNQNNRLYWANDTDKGLGQIPAGVVAEMIRIGKQPAAYNICRPVVDNVVGAFLQAPLSFDFRPMYDEINSLTHAARDTIFSESEMMDWPLTIAEMLIDGCIYRADVQMYLDRSDKKNTYIGLRMLPTGDVVYPPKLATRHKDRKYLYRRRMMTALEMLDYFSGKREKIIQSVMYKQFGEKALEELAKLEIDMGTTFGPNTGILPFANNQEMWGSEYEVIFLYHMERVTRTFEYVLTEDEDQIRIPSDLTDPNDKTITDEVRAQAKILWLNQNTPGWSYDAVFADDEDVEIQYMTPICPSLAANMLMCDNPTDEQVGMLSIAPWSAYFKGGEFGGLIDGIKDLQMSLNWIENTLQYRLHVDGEGTAWYAYPEAFISPDEYQRWKDCKNKAGEVFAMKPGMEARFPKGPAIPVQKSPYPKEAVDRLEHFITTLLPILGKYTPASRGQEESSGESGYLFNLKKLQNDVERKILFESRKNFMNLLGEMWLNQAILVHGNKIAKKFYNPSSDSVFEINKVERETLPSGEQIEYLVNDMSKLKDIRHRVIIVESPDSPTRKAENMQIASEVLRGIQNPAAVPISYVSLTHAMLKGTENLSDTEKQDQEQIFAKEMELAEATADAQIAQQKFMAYQAMAQMQPQPMAQPGQVQGMSGVPAGGGGVPGSVPAQSQGIPQQSETIGNGVYSGVEQGAMA